MSNSNNNWIVLAGGPNSGKTTLIDELSKRGYKVKPEQAMVVINEYLASGVKLENVHTDPVLGGQFQRDIALKELAAAAEFSPDELVFFDRWAPDYFAFAKIRNLKKDEEIIKKLADCSYKHIFVLDLLKNEYADNKIEAHLADPIAVAIQQEEHLIDVINDLHMEFTRVPVMSVDDRIEYILEALKTADTK